MERRPAVRSRLNILAAAAAALVAAASLAYAEPPAGTKNFNSPGTAPNYFSNEGGPVMRQPAPLPAVSLPGAPPVVMRTAPAMEEPEGQPEAAAPKAERQTVRSARGRDRHRTVHAPSRTVESRKNAAVRGRNAKPARVAARVEKPRAAKMAHAEPRAVKVRPVAAKGRAGRG